MREDFGTVLYDYQCEACKISSSEKGQLASSLEVSLI